MYRLRQLSNILGYTHFKILGVIYLHYELVGNGHPLTNNRPVKSHAIGINVTHSSTNSRSHAKKKKSHATFQILLICLSSNANKKNVVVGKPLSCTAKSFLFIPEVNIHAIRFYPIFQPSVIQLMKKGKIGNQDEMKFGPVIMSIFMFLSRLPY